MLALVSASKIYHVSTQVRHQYSLPRSNLIHNSLYKSSLQLANRKVRKKSKHHLASSQAENPWKSSLQFQPNCLSYSKVTGLLVKA
jgi:hypothetical protein